MQAIVRGSETSSELNLFDRRASLAGHSFEQFGPRSDFIELATSVEPLLIRPKHTAGSIHPVRSSSAGTRSWLGRSFVQHRRPTIRATAGSKRTAL
jgi:hypothetical protein